jgi:hypothetical protein
MTKIDRHPPPLPRPKPEVEAQIKLEWLTRTTVLAWRRR